MPHRDVYVIFGRQGFKKIRLLDRTIFKVKRTPIRRIEGLFDRIRLRDAMKSLLKARKKRPPWADIRGATRPFGYLAKKLERSFAVFFNKAPLASVAFR